MERLQTSDVSIDNGNIKCPIRTSFFAVNLTLKLFHVTLADADIGSQMIPAMKCWLVNVQMHVY